MNEPNHNRNGTPVRPDWPELTVGYQRVVRTFLDSTPSLARAVSVGPSLRMGADDPTPDFYALRYAGLVPYLDYAGLHTYPSGWGPVKYVDLRPGWVRDAWGDVPTWVTGTGYNTAMGLPMAEDGPEPGPEDVAATYGPRSVIEFATGVQGGASTCWKGRTGPTTTRARTTDCSRTSATRPPHGARGMRSRRCGRSWQG